MQKILKVLFCIPVILICLYAYPSQGQIINGDFSNGLSGWYERSWYEDGWHDTDEYVSIEDGTAVIRTGGINGPYITSLSTDFMVSGDRLTFRYYFDIVGPDDIKDPDYPSFGPDFFQVTLDAGDAGYFYEDIAWNPTIGFIPFSMDISPVAPGTRATLGFMLFDEDDEQFSMAAIEDVSDPAVPVPEPGTLIILGGGLIGLFIHSRYRRGRRACLSIFILCVIQFYSSGIVYGELIEENVEEMISLEFTSPLFNTRTNTLTLNMGVTNISTTPVFTPLKVVITGISAPDVKVANPDGYTPDGMPFFDLTTFIDDTELSPGEKAPAIKISFYNPKRVKFRWDQDVVALMDVYTEKGPVIFDICLKPGESPPVCEFYYEDFEIEDPEFDRLLQRPLPEEYMYEQVRVYAFDNEGLPLKVTINGGDARYNKWGFYFYRDIVLQDGLNTISIVVTNDAGFSAAREISLQIDSIPPLINVSEPAGGAVSTIPYQVISGTVDDLGVNKVILIRDFIYREEVPVLNGKFSAPVTLSPGHNNISIRASDMAGNTAYYNLDIVYVYSEFGEITGRIYNNILGLPISGATVTAISGSDDNRIAVVSGDEGTYRVGGVRSGDVILRIEKDGYNPVNLKVFSPGGTTPYTQDVALIPVSNAETFTLTGQIKDTGGSPLQDARISIKGTSLSAISDHNGIYIITGIPRTSFVADVSLEMYEAASINVYAGQYGKDTAILTHSFILKDIVSSIEIISPIDGEYVSGDDVLVIGFVRNGDREVGVRVNGVLAQVYNGSFVANDVPLDEGANRITAEMIDPSGTILADSADVILSKREGMGAVIYAQNTGIVPIEITVEIEVSPGISFDEYSMEISGPGTAELISEGPLQHRVFISKPGVYTLTFNAIDSMGNRYKDTYGFTGMAREDIEGRLRLLWVRLKNDLIANDVADALSLFTPDTRGIYREQFSLLGDRLSDIFSSIGEIDLISLKDNLAKTRVYEGDITHYVWFARDIYGLWKIHKF